MGGVSASAGFAYQHAQAVHRVLDLVDLDGDSYVRVEATNDVVDVEIYTGDDTLVQAAQFKMRDQKYTWGATELVSELVRWSSMAATYPEARYEFVTDGRLGPTGRQVQEALEAVRHGRMAALADLARDRNVPLDPASCARASIVADTPGFDQLILDAVERVTSLLPHVTGELEAEERGIQTVHELLRSVVGRSGDTDPGARVITKAELDALLSDSREYVATESWSPDLRSAFVEAVDQRTSQSVRLRCEVTNAGAPPGTAIGNKVGYLDELITSARTMLLSGPTGSGKSTIIKHAQVAAASRGDIVIVVDAENYIPNRLGSLVAHGINSPGFIGAYSATGLKALNDPAVTVIIDSVSEVPSPERNALATELKQLIASDIRAKLVLAGRDSAILQGFIPRRTPVYPMVVERLNRQRRLKILSEISQGALDEHRAQEITAQVEHALQGAANNPQFFVVGATLIAAGSNFNDPASMYRQYVHSRGEEVGYTSMTVLEVGLGVAFAALADAGRRHCDSFAWTEQLSASASALQAGGHDVTASELREFGFETGLIVRSGGDVIRAVHDSFADYFAAVAHARAAAPLPETFQQGDAARIRFLVELAGVTDQLSRKIASDLPFLSPAAAEREDRQPNESWYEATQALVADLYPGAVKLPRIAFWQTAGTHLVTVDGTMSGWIGERTLVDVGADALTFEASRGPLSVATTIWRRRLRAQLDCRRRGTVSVPRNHEQTVAMLAAYSDALAVATHEMTQEIAPVGHQGVLVGALGPYRIEFALDTDRDAADQRERRVQYRYLDILDNHHAAVQVMATKPDESWTGRARVDSFLGQEPSHAAARTISQAVNKLVDRRWI